MAAAPTVGFDLDMTLIDPRPGVRAAFEALIAETGVAIDIDTVLGRLGPPLEIELASWAEPARISELAGRYRALYLELGVPGSTALPGAHEALAAVHTRGGRSVVVTAKEARNARACIAHTGLAVDVVVGLCYGDGKVDALRDNDAAVYVGDTTTDVESGRAAGCTTVAVATGPHRRAALTAAGAHLVLDSLTAFPGWLDAKFPP